MEFFSNCFLNSFLALWDWISFAAQRHGLYLWRERPPQMTQRLLLHPVVFILKYFCKAEYYAVFSVSHYWQQESAIMWTKEPNLPDLM